MDSLRKLLKSKEAAEYLQVSERTIWTLQKTGQLKAVKIGRSIRFDPDDLSEFVEQMKTAV